MISPHVGEMIAGIQADLKIGTVGVLVEPNPFDDETAPFLVLINIKSSWIDMRPASFAVATESKSD